MNDHLIEQAFKELYPDREFSYITEVKYSAKFNNFNANIRLSGNRIEFHMSKEWKQISEEIQIGLIQGLLVRIFSKKSTKKIMTNNMDLYNKFLKNVHIAIPKEVESDYMLQKFNKINDQFFDGLLEQPSLRWGSFSKNKLGSYEYGSDTIVLSKYLENAPEEYMGYVLYHEMLHKKHKFTHNNGRSFHHTPLFKADEAKFPRAAELEKEIPKYISRKRSPFRKVSSPQTFQALIRNFFG